MPVFDVVVVGGGPSGSLAALRLAKSGASVALCDPSHPREKPCGGGVTARALGLVEDVATLSPSDSVPIRRALFLDSSTGRSATVPLTDAQARLVVASRARFDGILFDAAGAVGVTCIPTRALDVGRDAGRMRIETATGAITADWVIGADGANSLVRRRVAAAFSRGQLSIATGVYAHGVTSDEIVVEMTARPPGYIWSFPRPDHLAIGICAQADAGVGVAELRHTLDAWLAQTNIARDARLERYSWPIPSLGASDFSGVPIAGPGWITIGDAAGLVDPITREGIFFALQSAEYAADALGRGGAGWAHYQQRVREEIGHELARAARFKAGFFRPAFSRLLLSALESSAPVRAIMADLIAGTQSYRDLKWRLLKTFEIGLAWKVMTASLSGRDGTSAGTYRAT